MGSKGTSTKTYTPDAAVGQAGHQAINMATAAAMRPYQNAVAGFNPLQEQGFQQIQDMQGMYAPYFDRAGSLAESGAAQVTPDDINKYFDPYAKYVMGNLREGFGIQRRDTTGQLTQAAGGVGADRIAVGQAELARKQGLVEGQTASDIYGRALAAAQADKGRQGQAAYTFGMLGPAAQNAALTGTGALLGAGGQQQQNAQQRLSSELAYPFQTAQYLSGVTGGLAGAMGGTETATPAQPSILSQLIGLGTGALGYAGSQGLFSSGSGNPAAGTGSGSQWNNPGVYGSLYRRGGRVGFAGGGAPVGPVDSVVPFIPMQPSQRHQFAKDEQPSGGGGPSIGDLAKVAMMFLADGGPVTVKDAYKGFAAGGVPEADPSFDERWRQSLPSITMQPESTDSAPNYAPIPVSSPEQQDAWRARVDQDIARGMTEQPVPGAPAGPMAAPPMAMQDPSGEGAPPNIPPPQASVPAPNVPYAGSDLPFGPNRKMDAGEKFTRSPWLGLVQAGLATAAGSSPWAGINIAKGAQEGIKALQGQRAEGREEETINQRAKKLMQDAQEHLDKYNKIPLLDEKRFAMQEKQFERQSKLADLEAMKPFKIGQDQYGREIFGTRDPKTGQIKPIRPDGTPIDTPQDTRTETKPQTPVDTETVSQGPSEIKFDLTDKPDTPSRDESALEGQPEAINRQVRAIAEGRTAPLPLARNNPYNRKVMELVNAYDPSFDASLYGSRVKTVNAFKSGKEAGNITSLNTVAQHLNELAEASKELGGYNTKYPMLNPLVQGARRHVGDEKFQKVLSKYQTAAKAVATESARAFMGSNQTALADREAWEKKFDPTATAAEQRAAIAETVKLLYGRVEALTDQYNTGMRTSHAAVQLLQPKTRKVYENLIAGSEGGATETARPKSREEYDKLKPGTKYITPDGQELTKR